MRKSGLFRDYLMLHITVFILGFTAILGELITIPSIHMVWYRMLLAFGGILVFMVISKTRLKTSPNTLLLFMGAGCITAAHWIFFFEAIKRSNVSICLAALSSTTLFVAMLEPLFFRRRISLTELFFGGLVIVGLLIILNTVEGSWPGLIMGLISAFLAALLGTINGVFAKQQHPPVIITLYEMAGGVAGTSVLLLFTQSFDAAFFQVSASNLGWLCILAFVCTSFAFVVSVNVMKRLSPFTVSLAFNMERVYGIILAVLIFRENERMTPGFYFGAALILLTIFAHAFRKHYQRKPEFAAKQKKI